LNSASPPMMKVQLLQLGSISDQQLLAAVYIVMLTMTDEISCH
jgi:hypothetical protein